MCACRHVLHACVRACVHTVRTVRACVRAYGACMRAGRVCVRAVCACMCMGHACVGASKRQRVRVGGVRRVGRAQDMRTVRACVQSVLKACEAWRSGCVRMHGAHARVVSRGGCSWPRLGVQTNGEINGHTAVVVSCMGENGPSKPRPEGNGNHANRTHWVDAHARLPARPPASTWVCR